MDERFLRNEMLWGKDGQARLTAAHVIVFGLGGVGSYVAECLARAGVGELTLVDSDTVALSNLNRQLEALDSTVGLPKAEAVARRVRDINPYAVLHPMEALYNADNREQFFPAGCRYDYIVDAIDLVSCKLDLLETAGGWASPSSWPWVPAASWTPLCCDWRIFRRPTAARWPGSCGRSCGTGASSTRRWSFPRNSLRLPSSWRLPRRDGGAFPPVTLGFPPLPDC